MIFIIIFLLWIIFNGRITTEIVLLGLLLASAVTWFDEKYIGHNNLNISLKRLPALIDYLFTLIIEIIKANIVMIKITLAPKLEFEPCIIYFKTDLKEQFTKVLLANSITLTPGTITASLEGDTFCVHCLDKSMALGINDSIFVQKLRKIEEI